MPVDRAPELRLGLPVQLLDADGKPAAVNPISFVAPRVDESTQSVLVKSLLKDVPPRLRAQQFARARIVWSTVQGLTVPVVAVTRLSGQYFCFVAEQQDKGLVARQRPVQVGEVLGDDYVVTGGLKAGDRIVVSGIQKLARRRADQGRSRSSTYRHVRRHLHPPADPGLRLLARPDSRRGDRDPDDAGRAVPAAGAARSSPSPTFYTGADAQAVETAVTTPLEQAINGVEGMLYMTSSSTNSGAASISVVFDVTRDSDIAAVDVQNRVSTALARLPTEVRTNGVTVQKGQTGFVLAAGVYAEKAEYDSLFISNYIDVYVKDALKRVRGGRQRPDLRRAPLLDAAVARPRQARQPRPDGGRRRQRAARAEHPGRGRRHRAVADARRSAVPDQRARGGPAARAQRVRERHHQGRRRRLAGADEGRRHGGARRRNLRDRSCASRASTPSASA